MTKSNTQRFVGAAWSLLTFQMIAGVGAVAVTAWAAFAIAPRLSPTEQAMRAVPADLGPGQVGILGEAALGGRLSAEFTPDPDGVTRGPSYQWLRNGQDIPGATDQNYAPGIDDVRASLRVRARYDDVSGQGQNVTSQPVVVPPPPLAATPPRCSNSGQTVGAAGTSTIVIVEAGTGWCDTGMDIRLGNRVIISATGGAWSYAGEPRFGGEGESGSRPAGLLLQSADRGSLIGRIGDVPFSVGRATDRRGSPAGRLYLSMNDIGDDFYNNNGSLTVGVLVFTD